MKVKDTSAFMKNPFFSHPSSILGEMTKGRSQCVETSLLTESHIQCPGLSVERIWMESSLGLVMGLWYLVPSQKP